MDFFFENGKILKVHRIPKMNKILQILHVLNNVFPKK